MRKRSTFAAGVAILWAAACGGDPFSTEGVAGSGGESAGRPGTTGGSSSKAGGPGKGGSSSKAGESSTGGTPVGVAGTVSVAGVVGVSGSMTGEAGSPDTGTTCLDPSECEASSRCVEATCSGGECGEKPLPDGPFKLQVPGDCKQARCEGGHEVLELDANDSDDMLECTADSCDQSGNVKHTPMVGAACGNGDQCDAQGMCVDCVDNGGCNEAQVCDVASQVCKSDTD